jgi:2,4-diketo-3-deoxy-L-fuconate hydrolase
MKLIRFVAGDRIKTGIVSDGRQYDTSGFGEDYNEDFFADNGIARLADYLQQQKDLLPEVPQGSPLAAPVARPSKIICIGLNYADHARETGATPPTEPVIFLKATTALCGPNDDIISTGTPAGVAMGMSPQPYLKPGDVVELGIDGLGTSRQELKAYHR